MGKPIDDCVDLIRELEQQRARLVERLSLTTMTIRYYLDGTWEGTEEQWNRLMDLNHEAIQSLRIRNVPGKEVK
jgi:hypothetical protein